MNQAGQVHAVTFSRVAFFIHDEFRHDKQGDAFYACRGAFDLRQHHVNDVFGEGLFAAGDVDLGAFDQVMTVVSRRGRGADISQ